MRCLSPSSLTNTTELREIFNMDKAPCLYTQSLQLVAGESDKCVDYQLRCQDACSKQRGHCEQRNVQPRNLTYIHKESSITKSVAFQVIIKEIM